MKQQVFQTTSPLWQIARWRKQTWHSSLLLILLLLSAGFVRPSTAFAQEEIVNPVGDEIGNVNPVEDVETAIVLPGEDIIANVHPVEDERGIIAPGGDIIANVHPVEDERGIVIPVGEEITIVNPSGDIDVP